MNGQKFELCRSTRRFIYLYIYNIISSDDGINSAGDIDTECEPGGENWNNDRNHPRGREGGFRRTEQKYPKNLRGKRLVESYSFHMYIYGGEIFVNAESDVFDANGNIVISGGNK